VWTGDHVLIWGGGGIGTDSWGAYDPKTDLWDTLPGYPQGFTGPMPGGELAVWTGKYFMVFARGVGARYELATRQWTRMSFTNIPYAEDGSAVWTGSLWIIWGGHTAQDTGAAYDPATDVWTPLPVLNAPVPTYHHLAAWTGSQMLIFGGGTDNAPALIDPAVYVYDPVARAWSHTNTGASGINASFPFVSTSQSVLLWEGWEDDHSPAPPGHALWWADYSWRPIQTINQPAPRLNHSATWTGREMIIWGGQGMLGDLVDGVRYTP
jgi:hypothetical protein